MVIGGGFGISPAGRLPTIANLLKVPVTTFDDSPKGSSKENSPLELLTKRDAFKLAEAFDRITSQRVRNSLVALAQDLAEPD